MNKRIVTLLLILILSFMVTYFLLADDSLKSAAGFWTGKIIYGENNTENILIRIYDQPIESQKGYLVTEGSKYQLITINDVYINKDSLCFKSNHVTLKIIGKYNSETKEWDCKRINGKKEFVFTSDLLLERADSKPDWASDIKHVIYKDGVYEANIAPSRWGHRPFCKVTVKNSRIVDVQYYEKHDTTGQLKDKNYGYEYIEEFGESAYAGAQLSVAGASVYGPRLVLSQSLDNIDVVTGATANYNRFKSVVGKALKDAIIKIY